MQSAALSSTAHSGPTPVLQEELWQCLLLAATCQYQTEVTWGGVQFIANLGSKDKAREEYTFYRCHASMHDI